MGKYIMASSNERQKKRDRYEGIANILIFVGVIVLVVGFYIFMNPMRPLEDFGAYGEYFGGIVGSIWTLAGVILFYAALKAQQREFEVQRQQLEMQRKELQLQRQETELQRKEFERQTQQLITQNNTLNVQKFENTIFHMLQLHNEIVVSNESRDLGKKWAKSLYIRFIGNYQRNLERTPELTKMECIEKTYRFFKMRPEYLDRYFRNLMYILKFVEHANIDNKIFYIGLIRAQLTIHEQLFLFYFSLSEFSSKEFRSILEEYRFFEELPLDELIDSEHKALMNEKAFEKRD